jgi:hypothetical protein
VSYFAKIDEEGVVTTVIAATQEVIDSGLFGDPAEWVETDMEGNTRNQYAGIGMVYIKELDSFVEEKPKQYIVQISDDELELNLVTKKWELKDSLSPKAVLLESITTASATIAEPEPEPEPEPELELEPDLKPDPDIDIADTP